jgi:hypothetical protein
MLYIYCITGLIKHIFQIREYVAFIFSIPTTSAFIFRGPAATARHNFSQGAISATIRATAGFDQSGTGQIVGDD